MGHVERRIRIDAEPSKVWPILADLEREPEIWRGTKAVRTLSAQGNVVEREVTLAFRDRRQRERVRIETPERLRHEILEGPMRGTKTVSLRPTGDGGSEVIVAWDITLRGLLKLGTRRVEEHIGEGTQHALERIKERAEGRAPSA